MNQIGVSQASLRAVSLWRVMDGDRTSAVVDTWDQLREVLLTGPKRALCPNTIVDLVSPRGDTLSLGIAGPLDRDNPGMTEPLACLNFTGASLNPPYLTAVGDPSLTYEKGGVVVFRYGGEWTEILRRNCVPVEKMLEVVKHFFLTGSLPIWIPWEEV